MASLPSHWHGKSRVRVLKRSIQGAQHSILEITVDIKLWGDYEHVYTRGDNSELVATDTMKNTVYVVAKTTQFNSLEQYGMLLTNHFLSKYPVLHEVEVTLKEHPWERVNIDGKAHQHGFVKTRLDYHAAKIRRTRSSLSVQSSLRDLVVLKTTQSGFVGFLRDENTSLPEVTDRLLSSSISADWTYAVTPTLDTDFNLVYETIRAVFLKTFFGPADRGVYSKSVQETMYTMGNAVLAAVSEIPEITLDMPNIHYLPLRSLTNHGLEWSGEVHMPTDEPHGTIGATVARSRL